MKKILPLILISIFLLAACGYRARYSDVPTAPDVYNYEELAPAADQGMDFLDLGNGGAAPEAVMAPMATAGPNYDQPASGTAATDGSNVSAAQVERMVIQNADLAIIVADVDAR